MSCKSMIVYSSALVLTGVVLLLTVVHGSSAEEQGKHQKLAMQLTHLTDALEQGEISRAEYQSQRRSLEDVMRDGRLC